MCTEQMYKVGRSNQFPATPSSDPLPQDLVSLLSELISLCTSIHLFEEAALPGPEDSVISQRSPSLFFP